MSNLFWYVGLALISIAITSYTIYMKRDVYKVSTLMVFYLFSTGFIWIGEFIALGLFNAYEYKVGLINDPWAQNLLGHLILNTTLYPSTAIVMAAYSLRLRWTFVVAAIFVFLEYVFIKLGIYEQHWWRYYMTAAIVIVYLSIIIKWFPKIYNGCRGLKRAVTFYFVAMILIHTPAPLLLLLGKQHYQMNFINNLVGNFYLSSIIIIFSYHLIESFLLVVFTCILKKWYWKVFAFVFSIGAQSIFAKMNILIMDDGWNLFYALVVYEIFIAAYILIEKYTLKPVGNEHK